jgi:leader peptidase (prepilin peptidase)/N-methyltransferase
VTDAVAVLAVGVLGVAAGWASGPVADRLARTRYAVGAPDHDPEDTALAPLRGPTSPRARVGAALACGLAGTGLTATIGWGMVLLPFVAVAWVGLTASIVDLQYLRLPNVLTYGGAAAALALCAGGAYWYDDLSSFRGAVTGSLLYAGMLLLMLVLFRVVAGLDGLGLGDVKLALALGAPLGWYAWTPEFPILGALQVVSYAAMFGAVTSVLAAAVLTGFERGRAFPFGPSLVAGWLVAALLVDTLGV